MKILLFLSPLVYTLAALVLVAVESSLFPRLGIPTALTPDLNLVLIVFLTSTPFRLRGFFSALGISLAASLFGSSPGFPLAFGHLAVYFAGLWINQTVFMNHIFPQALFAGAGRFILTLGAALMTVLPEHLFFKAAGGGLTTAMFAFPILFLLNLLRERYQPQTTSSISS
ncbi:MAG: hypothetical protein GXO34_04975 [Deltaproteobacteria bacterium]|nr:hypothetical protein [Deltaproteobacteria bacterium]